jgi:mono/diheme cytochrome c family protein
MRFFRGFLFSGTTVLALACLAGCNDDSTSPAPYVPDVAHGQYLVQHVAGCGDCHTPMDNTGQPIAGLTLAGGQRFDLPFGAVYARNLTPDNDTGLGTWSVDQIATAIRTGTAPAHTGRPATDGQLFPVMPYWLYGSMTSADAQDIAAYLKSVPAVHNAVPVDSIPEAMRVVWPLQTGIPDATPASATTERGKYLVTVAGCIDCHTKPKSEVTGNPADPGVALDLFLAGGREFGLGPLGTIHSKNITPDSTTGIGNWTTTQIDSAIAYGYDDERRALCPPMPWPVFQGMTSSDREAIIAYLRGIPGVVNDVPDDPTVCPR